MHIKNSMLVDMFYGETFANISLKCWVCIMNSVLWYISDRSLLSMSLSLSSAKKDTSSFRHCRESAKVVGGQVQLVRSKLNKRYYKGKILPFEFFQDEGTRAKILPVATCPYLKKLNFLNHLLELSLVSRFGIWILELSSQCRFSL